jgi:subtilisin family serine protease
VIFLLILTNCGSDNSNSNIEPDNNNSSDINYSAEPYFKYLWHINSKNSILNMNGYHIDENADINITNSWQKSQGEDIIVAIIDDGADLEHEDIKENILLAYNADEDSFHNINPHKANGSHGNKCAGIIASPINNIGIIGIAPKAKLIIIRQEDNSDLSTIRAFEYAKNQGANIVSCSWGSYNVSDAISQEIKSLYDANITIVFSAGNEGISLDEPGINDESELPWVIGVAASDEYNELAYYSNYGSNIDILAPGGDIYRSSGILTLDDMGYAGNTDMQRDLVNNNYSFVTGTSFSAPIVAGVVALIYKHNSSLSPEEIRRLIISSADKIDQDNADYNSNGFDLKHAYGKINVGKIFNSIP